MQQNHEIQEHLYGLYDAIAHGEIRTSSILAECIMLIGLTRVGKSTVFNWINNKGLIGRENDYGVVNYYLLNQNDSQAAQVSDLQTSKTLIPNVCNVNNVTRIDTAGFKDKRNHVGVFSVNCMLNFIFQKAQKCKFILVVCRDQLGQTGQPLLDTLFKFINLFDYENLDDDAQKRLNSSVSLLVTKSRLNASEDDKIKKMLSGIIANCSKPSHRSPKKQICLKLLSDILQSQRIQLFSESQVNKHAPKCQILGTFERRGWESFNLAQAKLKYPKILVNSFEAQFNLLDKEDQDQYMNTIKKRVQSYNLVSKIFADIISITIIQITQPFIDYSQIFTRMNEFIVEFDQYTEINKNIKNRLLYLGMSLKRQGINQLPKQQTIKTMIRIRSVVQFISTIDVFTGIEQNLLNTVEILRQTCLKIFLIIQELCCLTTLEQNTLINFAYIVLRGFQEFSAITKIDPLRCISAHRNIRDCLISLADRTIIQQKLNIIQNICNLEPQKKLAAFPKLTGLAQYLSFFEQFILQHEHELENEIIDRLNHKKIQDKLCYCQLLIEQGIDGYDEALRSSIKLTQDILNYRQTFQATINYSEDLSSNPKAIQLQNNFLSCFKIIGNVLFRKKMYASAINIFNTIEDTASVLECYERQIKHLSQANQHSLGRDSSELQESYYNYSDYCCSRGRVEKAIELMQNYQRIVTSSTKIRMIKQKLVGFIRGREASYGSYQTLLLQHNGLFTIPQDNLRNLINEIIQSAKVFPENDLAIQN